MTAFRVDNVAFLNRGPYTFVVESGQCLGLSGESGAGKSLLLRALADLDPHTGRISLGSVECDEIPAPRWRQLVGMLPAESGWWFDTVGEHFSTMDDHDAERLSQLGFTGNVLSWQISRLSTGEKQRLAIVRLLANNPRALLLDEPTASLDASNISRVENLLIEYCRVNTAPILWVSHDPGQLARVADRVMIIQPDGKMIESE